MPKIEDQDTRYYIDLDLQARTIIGWDYGQRQKPAQELADPHHQRIFITKGQYNKLESRYRQMGEYSHSIILYPQYGLLIFLSMGLVTWV